MIIAEKSAGSASYSPVQLVGDMRADPLRHPQLPVEVHLGQPDRVADHLLEQAVGAAAGPARGCGLQGGVVGGQGHDQRLTVSSLSGTS